MKARAIVIGSGTSTGVPMIGCRCPVCLSDDPKNQRARPAIAIDAPTGRILVDAPQELRLQLLRFGLDDRMDAALITHTHADHIFGLDDLRGFTEMTGRAIPVYAEQAALDDLERVFRYIRFPAPAGASKPLIEFHRIEGDFDLCGLRVEPLRVYHGDMPILAFRFGSLAYVTDVKRIPPESWDRLSGLDFLILDAVRIAPHPTHYNLEEALAVIAELKPKRAALTHLAHDFDHEATNRELPASVELCYDGMTIEFEAQEALR
ncbi:MAG: MBL fold metallo-hydrolase [Armatimonadetes bacterium]|nr:MBL fold metallo-hydrolase [Armatimonadota bacterium]